MSKALIKWGITLTTLCLLATSAHAEYFSVPGDTFYKTKTSTLLDRRFRNVMHQKYDFSCGSAALASLLTYHYHRPVEEKAVIDAMYKNGDKTKIRKEGFSLLDMKNYLTSVGLRSNGYRESLDKLDKVGIPAIVLINRKGYLHFVLVQGITPHKVLIGDPALGKKIMSRREFESMWQNHILFVIDDNVKQARKTFSTVYAWDTRSVSNFTAPLPNTNLATMTLFTSYSPNVFN